MEVAHSQIVVADVADGGARRGVDVEPGVAAELADPEEMGAVGDDDDVAQIILAGDGGQAVDLLLSVDGARLGDDVAEGNAVGQQIVAADCRLRCCRSPCRLPPPRVMMSGATCLR